MQNRIVTVALAAILIITAGCASVGRKLDPNKIAEIKKGESTRDDVIRLLGSPDQITSLGNGNTVFAYLYVRATAKGESFIPIVGAFAGGANVQQQHYQVTFGPDGKVFDFVSTYGNTESSTGLSTGGKADTSATEKNKRPR